MDNYFAQLFIDTGAGFNEKESIIKDVNMGEYFLVFELQDYKNIRALRFDPSNSIVALYVHKIEIVLEDGDNIEVSYDDNALEKHSDLLIFDTGDPNLTLNFDSKYKPIKIVINVDYIAFGINTYPYIIENQREILKIKEQNQVRQIWSLENRMAEIQAEAEIIEQNALAVQQPTPTEHTEFYKELLAEKEQRIKELHNTLRDKESEVLKAQQAVEIRQNNLIERERRIDELSRLLQEREVNIVGIQKEIEYKNTLINEKDKKVSEVIEKERRIEELNRLLHEKETTITAIQKEVELKNALIAEKDKKVNESIEKERRIEELNRSLHEKETTITAIQKKVELKNALIAEKDKKVNESLEKERRIEELNRSLHEKETTIITIQKDIEHNKRRINDYENTLKTLDATSRQNEINAITYKKDIELKETILAQREREVKDITQTIREKEQAVVAAYKEAELKNKLILEKEKRIGELHNVVKEKEFGIEAIQKEVALKEQTILEKDNNLAQQTALLNQLRGELDAQRKHLESKETTIAQKMQKIEDQSQEILIREREISNLHSQVEIREHAMTNHQVQIEEFKKLLAQKKTTKYRSIISLTESNEVTGSNGKSTPWLFAAMLVEGAKRPGRLLGQLNKKNFNTLRHALKNESPRQIARNFRNLLLNGSAATPPETLDLSQNVANIPTPEVQQIAAAPAPPTAVAEAAPPETQVVMPPVVQPLRPLPDPKNPQGQVVVFISPNLPDYDTSSGGKRATRMVALMAEAFDVYLFTLGEKPERHVVEIQRLGARVLDSPFLHDINIKEYDHEDIRAQLPARVDAIIYAWYDTYYLSSKLTEFYPNAKIIFDSVDVHWVRLERLIGVQEDLTMRNVLIAKKNEIDNYRKGDIVWAVTEEDKQAVIKEIPDADVRVVSNIHDAELTEYTDPGTNNILFFGGYRHTPNISAIKVLALEILPLVRKEIPDAKLLIAGAHAPDEVRALAENEGVEFRGFIEEEDLPKLYEESFVTVIPLLAGAGIKGKICEAIAFMLPIVTNDVGNEGIRLETGISGLVSNDIEEMANLTIKAMRREYDMAAMTAVAQEKLFKLVGSDVVKQRMIDSVVKEVSICIVTWNRLELVKRCIESIIEHTTYPKYKILVHSNGCADGTQDYLASAAAEDERIVPILSKDNDVFVIPNNNMMQMYPENDVVLVNNDVYVTPNWLTALHDAAYTSKDIGITGSKLLYPDGRLQEFGSELYANGTGNNIGKFQDPNKDEYNHVRTSGYVSGCSFYVKRSTIKRIGVFDLQFHPCYCEDSDYCYTAWEHGLKTVVTPHSVVYHDEGGTSGTDTSSGFKAFQEINFLKFMEKHRGKVNGINWGLEKITLREIENSVKAQYKDPIGRMLLNGTQAVRTNPMKLHFDYVASYADYQIFKHDMVSVSRKRFEVERILSKNNPGAFDLPGYNPMLGETTTFNVNADRPYNFANTKFPNYRESLYCEKSGSNSRLRAVATLIDKYMDGKDSDKVNLFFTEQITPFFKHYKEKYKHVTGSEYKGPDLESGKIKDGIRHEDLSQISYKKKQFDLLITLEVLQFFPNYKQCFKEIHRCLKDEGWTIMTVPFDMNRQYNNLRTTVNEDGSLKHDEAPIYYNTPAGPAGGLLCYQHFGWEMLDELREAGFSEVKATFVWSLNMGILGSDVMVILAKK